MYDPAFLCRRTSRCARRRPIALSRGEVAFSFLAARFAPACVLVNLTKTDLVEAGKSVNLTNLPFQTNIGTKASGQDFEKEIRKVILNNRQTTFNREFWVAYMVGAFQPLVGHDCDPNAEDKIILGGFSVQRSNFGELPGTFLFLETMKDSSEYFPYGFKIPWDDDRKIVAVHEIGHLFVGGEHRPEDGPIMDSNKIRAAETPVEVDALGFGPAGLFRIISTMYPGYTYWGNKQ